VNRPDGNPQARRIADDALGILSATLGPVAEERFRQAYGEDWRTSRGIRSGGLGARSTSLRDEQELLGRIQRGPEFDKTLGQLLQGTQDVFRLAADLKDGRNALVHRIKSWEASDAWAVVNRTAGLLQVFGLLNGDTKAQLDALEAEVASIVAGTRVGELADLRRDYIQGLLDSTTYLDSSGINAGVASRVVKVRLEDVYVEPKLVEDPEPVAEGDQDAGDPWTPTNVDSLRRVVVLAGPGAGKTTLLRRVARRQALSGSTGTPRTPIFLTARAFANALELEPGFSLRRYIGERLTDRYGDLLLSELDLGRATVLVDGLDEVVDEAARNRVAGLVGDFTREHPNITLIATSRVVGFRAHPSWSAFSQLAIQPFDEDQQRDFVQGWAAILSTHDAGSEGTDDLLQGIKASEGARELASTPLLLTILVLLWSRGARLPDRMAELYDLATVTLLRDWPTRRLGRSFDDRTMLRLLEPIALELIQSGDASIGERAVLKKWAAMLAENEGLDAAPAAERALAVLAMVQEQTGILSEVGREAGEPRFSFLHKTFAEYLAGRGLAEDWDAGTLNLGRYLHRARWLPAVDFLVGHVGLRGIAAGSQIARAILDAEAPSEEYLRGNVGLVVTYMARGLEVEPPLRDRIVGLAIDRILDPDLEVFRTVRGRHLTTLRDRVPRRLYETRLEPNGSDTPRIRARRAWLRVLMDPKSDDALAAFIRQIGELVDGSPDGSFDIETALLELGAQMSPDNVLHLGIGVLFIGLDGPDFLAYGIAPRLRAGGVQAIPVTDLLEDRVQVGEFEPWYPEYHGLLEAPFETLLELLARDDIHSSIRETVVRYLGRRRDLEEAAQKIEQGRIRLPPRSIPWLSDQRNEYDDTGYDWDEEEDGDEVPEEDGSTEHGLAEPVDEDGEEERRAEEDHARYLAFDRILTWALRHGEMAVQQAALFEEMSTGWGLTGTNADLQAAVSAHPELGRAAALAVGLKGWEFVSDGALAWIEQLANDSPDSATRGLARRALTIARSWVYGIRMLSSPDVALTPDVYAPFPSSDAGELMWVLLHESASDDSQRVAARIARAVIEAGPDDEPRAIFRQESIRNAHMERLAHELAVSPRVESRRWAARLLRELERAPDGETIARLVDDADFDVQDLAVSAIHDVDLEDPGWVEGALLNVFELPAGPATEAFPHRVASELPRPAVDELVPLVEAFLDDHPGNPGALVFLEAARAGLR
jgi:hypothetical protein